MKNRMFPVSPANELKVLSSLLIYLESEIRMKNSRFSKFFRVASIRMKISPFTRKLVLKDNIVFSSLMSSKNKPVRPRTTQTNHQLKVKIMELFLTQTCQFQI